MEEFMRGAIKDPKYKKAQAFLNKMFADSVPKFDPNADAHLFKVENDELKVIPIEIYKKEGVRMEGIQQISITREDGGFIFEVSDNTGTTDTFFNLDNTDKLLYAVNHFIKTSKYVPSQKKEG